MLVRVEQAMAEYTSKPPTWSPKSFLHPCAQVDRDCVIGAGSRVWQFASVIRKAKVGDDCSIASCAIVDGSTIGDRVIISHGAFIDPGIVIGNDVFIGPHVSMCNDFWPRVTKDGWFNVDDLVSGKIVVTRIDAGASIGANAVLLPGISIGKGAMIAAGAVVTRSVEAGYKFTRDGYVQAIDPDREIERRRWVDCS